MFVEIADDYDSVGRPWKRGTDRRVSAGQYGFPSRWQGRDVGFGSLGCRREGWVRNLRFEQGCSNVTAHHSKSCCPWFRGLIGRLGSISGHLEYAWKLSTPDSEPRSNK